MNPDEGVIVAEVIRFTNFDFHQHYYDMPGTPLMIIGAIEWFSCYCWSVITHGFSLGTNAFSFQNIQHLYELLRLNDVFFFILSALLLFRLVARRINAYAGATAAVVLMTNSAYFATAASLRVESFSMCCLLAAILCLTECRPNIAPVLAGLLAGLGAACRLYSIAAAVPILVLLLLGQSWGRASDYTVVFKRRLIYIAAAVFTCSPVAIVVMIIVGRRMNLGYPPVFWFLTKLAVVLDIFLLACIAAYRITKTRWVVVNVITPDLIKLAMGTTIGFLIGTPTIVTQYRPFLASINFYLSDYVDIRASHLPLYEKVMSYLSFYLRIIAPDTLSALLLASGVCLLLIVPRYRVLWPYAVSAIAFFVSKPLDLPRAAHHVALWIPFYALLSSLLVGWIYDSLKAQRTLPRLVAPVVVIGALVALTPRLNARPKAVIANFAGQVERVHNIELSRRWIRGHTAENASFMVAFYCFGPEIYYASARKLDLDVPVVQDDKRSYEIWWGKQSALKGRSGYVCLTPSDVPYMEDWELQAKGEGINPLRDPRFQMLQSFGAGPYQVDILRFNLSTAK